MTNGEFFVAKTHMEPVGAISHMRSCDQYFDIQQWSPDNVTQR